MRKVNKNKLTDTILLFAIILLSASVIFGVVGGVRNRGNDDNIALDEEYFVDGEDVPNIDVPSGAHAFKIGDEWTYGYNEDTWEDWLTSEANTLGLEQDAEGQLYTTYDEITFYLCFVEYDAGLDSDVFTPITLSDTILFGATYQLIAENEIQTLAL
ncbi:MAG: hypothetical protein E7339_00215 [Clostridiales bacterium]|nr:hypothetical protein [Clostridiales bacterium]